MVSRSLLVGVAVLGIALGAVVGVHAAGDDYTLSVSPSQDIPDRSISIDGQDYPVTSLAVRSPGATFTVEASAPADATYAVNVWDADGDIQDSTGLTGDGTATFDASDFESPTGPYLVVIEAEGRIRTVTPVLFEAYDVSGTIPEETEAGSDVTVSAELEARSDESLSSVRAILAGSGYERIVELRGSDGEYAADLPTGDLSPGSYTVYVAATGTETIDGTEIPIGISDRHTLEVVEATPTPTATPTATRTESSSGGGGGGGSATATATATPTRTASATTRTNSSTATSTLDGTTAERTTGNETEPDATNDTETPEPSVTATTDAGDAETARPTNSSTPTDEESEAGSTTGTAVTESTTRSPTGTNDAITPNATEPADGSSNDVVGAVAPGQPGFTLVVALLAVILLAAIGLRRT